VICTIFVTYSRSLAAFLATGLSGCLSTLGPSFESHAQTCHSRIKGMCIHDSSSDSSPTNIMSQCAIGPDGKLLPAKDIQFFHDRDSSTPLPPSNSTVAARPQRSRRGPAKLLDVNNDAEPELSSHKDTIAAASAASAAAEQAKNLTSAGSGVKRPADDAGLASPDVSSEAHISSASGEEVETVSKKKKRGTAGIIV
jgi:hypothetical protein